MFLSIILGGNPLWRNIVIASQHAESIEIRKTIDRKPEVKNYSSGLDFIWWVISLIPI